MDAIADRDLTDAAREDIRDQLDRLGASAGYAIGAELWANDILGAAERIPGTRVTLLSVQAGGVDVSGRCRLARQPMDARRVQPCDHGRVKNQPQEPIMAVRIENTGVLNFGTFLAQAVVTHARAQVGTAILATRPLTTTRTIAVGGQAEFAIGEIDLLFPANELENAGLNALPRPRPSTAPTRSRSSS